MSSNRLITSFSLVDRLESNGLGIGYCMFSVGVATSSSLEAMPRTESAISLSILMRIRISKHEAENCIQISNMDTLTIHYTYSRTYVPDS